MLSDIYRPHPLRVRRLRISTPKIKAIMKRKGYTTRSLARAMGITVPTLHNYWNSKTIPEGRLYDIAFILSLNLTALQTVCLGEVGDKATLNKKEKS